MEHNINEIVSQMTLEEKAGMCSGQDFWHLKAVERLGIPGVMVSDGPHGLRKQDDKADNLGINDSIEAVCFPSAAGTAASFNRDLMYRLGETLGNECQAERVHVLLGPAVNIKRSPLCGRNFEYFSEDPCLSSEMAASYIEGVQSKHIGTSIKHFAANNQECRRMTVSSVVDERTLREIYLASFEGAIRKAKPWTVMCSYNRINGVYASENPWTLSTVLRDEWGFEGYVMTDWGAQNDRVEGLKAGLELEMPASGGINDKKIVEAVKNGTLDEKVLDRAVKRILNITLRYLENQTPDAVFDRAEDHQKAREAAGECMVLLKNNGVLPLNKSSKIVFIGEFAKKPRYQGGGSSHINPHRVESALDAAGNLPGIVYAQGYRTETEYVDAALLEEAVQAAKDCEAAVIFAGLPDSFESEGYDRKHIHMPKNQNYLISEICKVQPNTVVVLHNGSPVDMPWLSQTAAVLESYLAGEAVGGAQVDILFGDVNPSGKLAETFPLRLEDTPCHANFPGNPKTVEYREGLYVGYRYYDTVKKDVLFPFGYGLSYTEFTYSGLKLSKKKWNEGEELVVSFRIKNTGKVDGAEAAQIYVAAPESKVYRPQKELRGFAKVFLKAGEEKTVSVSLDSRAFSYYNVEIKDWHVESGAYQIMVGASSRDIRLSGKLEVLSAHPEVEALDQREILPAYYAGDVAHVPTEQFEVLLGHSVPNPYREPSEPFTILSTLEDVQDTKWGRRILNIVRKAGEGDNQIGTGEMMVEMLKGLPLRNYSTMLAGMIPEEALDGLLMLFNGKSSLLAGAKIVKAIAGNLGLLIAQAKALLKS